MTIAGTAADAPHGRAATLPALQYFRAAAAILVVAYHAACVFGPGGYQPVQSWEVGLLFGHAGVELFFVLSGFIICWIHYDRIGAAGEVSGYIRKRLVRIYPPVALVVVAWAALSFAAGMPLRPIEYLVSFTLIPFDFAYAPPALIIVSGVALGVLVYLFVEKPLLHWINGRIAVRRSKTAPARA